MGRRSVGGKEGREENVRVEEGIKPMFQQIMCKCVRNVGEMGAI